MKAKSNIQIVFATEKGLSEIVSTFLFFWPSFISPEVTSVEMFTTSPWKFFQFLTLYLSA